MKYVLCARALFENIHVSQLIADIKFILSPKWLVIEYLIENDKYDFNEA
jgi:hypothetical protein